MGGGGVCGRVGAGVRVCRGVCVCKREREPEMVNN